MQVRMSILKGLTFSLLFVACVIQSAQSQVATINKTSSGKNIGYKHAAFYVNESDAPVQIDSVKVVFIPLRQAERLALYEDRDQIQVTIFAKGKSVAAVQFMTIFYDTFDDHLGTYVGVELDPLRTQSRRLTFTYYPPQGYKFEGYGVAGICAIKARLRNGKLWDYDKELVLRTLASNFSGIREGHLNE